MVDNSNIMHRTINKTKHFPETKNNQGNEKSTLTVSIDFDQI